MFKPLLIAVLLAGVLIMTAHDAQAAAPADADTRAKAFIARYEKTIRPMEVAVSRLWWTANITGKDEDYDKKQTAETELNLKLADKATFDELKSIREDKPRDAVLRREIDVLYLQYLAAQIDPELIKQILEASNTAEKKFNNYRSKLDGKEVTDNEIRKLMRTSKDSAKRQTAWSESKKVGALVASDLKRLVKLRNQAAKQLGYRDFHVMQLALGEQDQAEVLRLFDALDELTREPFRKAKAEIDVELAKQCGVKVDELMPWHYHDLFFQESPAVFGTHREGVFEKADILKVCRGFFGGIGLTVDDVLQRSDLYEKPGKNPHAFCTDIDREGDVRVLANIVPGREWLSTMIHELGHAVYSSKNMPKSLPYALRTDSHPLTTEGIAMMFERFVGQSAWLTALGVDVPDAKQFDAAEARLRRHRLLIFSRWCQVMLRFEKELYGNPDQDLNKLWWDLVEKYQELKRPAGRSAPDYAAKIHIVMSPVYYHNYQMGELFAAQVHATIAREVLNGADPHSAVYVGNKAAGTYLREKIFEPGRRLNWNELTKHATGEPLGPRAFAAEISTK